MEPRPDYSGMIVNERFFSAGLLEDWDAAKKTRDRTRMIDLLSKVDLADQADVIADTILSNPQRYGL